MENFSFLLEAIQLKNCQFVEIPYRMGIPVPEFVDDVDVLAFTTLGFVMVQLVPRAHLDPRGVLAFCNIDIRITHFRKRHGFKGDHDNRRLGDKCRDLVASHRRLGHSAVLE